MESVQTSGRILVVDDEPSVCQLMNDALLRAGYDCQSCSSGEEALNALKREPFDIVIADLYMPGLSGMSLLEEGSRVRPESAFLMATGDSDVRVGVQAMKRGAADYLVKPFPIASLVESVRRAQQKKSKAPEDSGQCFRLLASKRRLRLRKALEEIDHLYNETVQTLGAVLDLRDNETAGHAQRVCRYTVETGRVMGFAERVLKEFARGALLHDIGKIGIPDAILNKPSRLTAEEYDLMKKHPEYGWAVLRQVPGMKSASLVILHHHENFDGRGYPGGLKQEEIPIGSRIVSVIDAFDAMVSNRPYRQGLPFEEAERRLVESAGTQFDPEVVRHFLPLARAEMSAVFAAAGTSVTVAL